MSLFLLLTFAPCVEDIASIAVAVATSEQCRIHERQNRLQNCVSVVCDKVKNLPEARSDKRLTLLTFDI